MQCKVVELHGEYTHNGTAAFGFDQKILIVSIVTTAKIMKSISVKRQIDNYNN